MAGIGSDEEGYDQPALRMDRLPEMTLHKTSSAPGVLVPIPPDSFDSPLRRAMFGRRDVSRTTLARLRLEPRQPHQDGQRVEPDAKLVPWSMPSAPNSVVLQSSEWLPDATEEEVAKAKRRALDEEFLALLAGPSIQLPTRGKVPSMPCSLDRRDMTARSRLRYPVAVEQVRPAELELGANLSNYFSPEFGKWHMAKRDQLQPSTPARPFERGMGGRISPAQAARRELVV
mmetsp:Transcript_98881/g.247963  ORF Transcript_98881/g.247963 Transcript_98881/m.247963 type:complete len:230 (-) Transcript_98881:74-763(-)|eukprot:CAMPEP_0115284774 /NCGR_PEP_ID=MMETSP0270-20121206/61077_1 /TAXON_ID=71861 /ORGANISM="Scrippsiella trochoidea, Strain CCMP3099" /LENGTH=229 /DNA_ID=CAMNT_0002701753 /DNA_START=41 /DNA_END=730 /DNA_ORIENTATION=+